MAISFVLVLSLTLLVITAAYSLPVKSDAKSTVESEELSKLVVKSEQDVSLDPTESEVLMFDQMLPNVGLTAERLVRSKRAVSNVGYCPQNMIWFGRKCVDFATYERLLQEYDEYE